MFDIGRLLAGFSTGGGLPQPTHKLMRRPRLMIAYAGLR
jgi:hypothetical protein